MFKIQIPGLDFCLASIPFHIIGSRYGDLNTPCQLAIDTTHFSRREHTMKWHGMALHCIALHCIALLSWIE